MARVIIHHNDVFNVYSTVIDAPIFLKGISYKELEQYIKSELGNAGLRELPTRVERARQKGTSSALLEDLTELIKFNRAGKDESCLTVEEFINQFLSGD